MFPRQVRLLNAGDYQSVFNDTSSKVFAGEFLLLARKHEGQARLGLIVSKKTDKRAVGRNRIKRVVRDSFRHQKDLLNGLDIIFLARHGIRDVDNPDLHKRLEKAWKQLAKKAQKPNFEQKQRKTSQK
ncbi:Ribonuclease P protein component [Marinomonas gallaica]|uniref:Ribonuclease P protein component n=2 Tax=Marinomonas gallaica TaxID=1806667 RepID=A0A1C3JRE7_9GAMM|nr:ribonuclease P protein component [Marinomonas atlantica]SBT17811.1 Ribonuclease P protein component [Marinomonas gallaica]SBT20137.1 Ribonuclease P protein component [Marinomonas gallaica]